MPRARAPRHFFPTAIVAIATGAVVALGPANPAAAGTKSFRQDSARDFEEGEANGTSILPNGEVIPGLAAMRLALDAGFAWCATASRDGEAAFFGTGDEGKIFSVPLRGGASGVAAAARPIATLDAAWVTSLATRADGALLAGTTPGGRVYVVNPKGGAPRVLATLPATHVWAIARDDKAAVTYVATGAPGRIFSVDDGGKSRQLWDSRDKHVVSLVRDTDGTLLAGTSEEAILYRVHPDGHAVALQDFEAEEVRAIVRAPSGLFVAVNDFEKPAPTVTPPGPVPAKGTKIVVGVGGPPASAGTLPRPSLRKSKAAVYRIEPDGRIEQVFFLADGYLTALAVADDGAVLAAAGTRGNVFRITPDATASLVIDLPERQALSLVRSGNRVLVGTGDVGGVYRAEPPAAGGGHYLSKVLDAGFASRWGALRWQGSGTTFETRSGNTAKPDSGWTAWKGLASLHADASGGAGGAGTVESPGARYVQYRATLAPGGGRLRAVTLYYLPQNQRARVTELGLADAGGAGATGTITAGAGTTAATATPRPPHNPTLKLRWKVDNLDGDDLIYRLHFRERGESVWRPLAGVVGDPLTKPEYDWNTEGLPDGSYVVHVVASDERVQPRERALTSGLDSAPLLVDNRKPEVKELTIHYPTVTGRAHDDASPITQIEFAVDGGDWLPIAPSDGIADDPNEPFAFRLPALPRGPHAVVVRATDSADNVGAADLVVTVP